MTASLPLPPLPEPARLRWQPLRAGLVELYYYDCEEFWFRDGHLLLRGNNGTGKSKVLSLTLPFLLDAHLGAARVEPDCDRSKRMEWNLLMGRHDRRTGYAWIEFGRRDEEGSEHYLTLGCGLSAVAGRSRLDAWHFLTDLRIGQDLWLITPERVVLGKEKLAERLGTRGQIFTTAQPYRRAVDERLFRLGEDRYRALMDTLITLRQPQLSKSPDEQKLSNALTESLPPLAQSTLEDVAEAMTQLDEYRDSLASHELLRESVAQFGRRYHGYARVQARRQAKAVRQAQTEFDNASRALLRARELHAADEEALSEAQTQMRHLEGRFASDTAALEELRLGPGMQDRARLRDAERAASEHARNAEGAAERFERARALSVKEEASSRIRFEESRTSSSNLQRESKRARDLAGAAGILVAHDSHTADLAPFDALPNRPAEWLEALGSNLAEEAKRRRGQTGQIRGRLASVQRAAQQRDLASATRNERAATLDDARKRTLDAEASLGKSGQAHVLQWSDFAAGVTLLTLLDITRSMEALEEWIESLKGDHPLLQVLRRAEHEATSNFAARQSELDRQRVDLLEQRAALIAERERLAKGEDTQPLAPHTRQAETRHGRRGAPFWQLLEFSDTVPHAERAGLEAALEAAGLLDAWVSPEGVLLDPNTYDTVLAPSASYARSLVGPMRAADNPPVTVERIKYILSSIALDVEDGESAHAWVSRSGQSRLGPLRGAWSKPAAQYIGFAAREAARKRRLEELAPEIDRLTSNLDAVDASLQALTEERFQLQRECSTAPSDEALRNAHAHFSLAESHRRAAQAKLAEADGQLNRYEAAWRSEVSLLEADARDLALPANSEHLEEVVRTIESYAEAAWKLIHATREHRRNLDHSREQEHRAREAQAQACTFDDQLNSAKRSAEEAIARRDVLRSSLGAQVAELEHELSIKTAAVEALKGSISEQRTTLNAALEARARSEQRVADENSRLQERQALRHGAVEQWRAFAQTGLLNVALPHLEVSDPSVAWTIDPALGLARRAEQALAAVPAEDADWKRTQDDVSKDFTTLSQAMSAQGHRAQAETSDFGLLVSVVYQNRPERPDILEQRLGAEIAQRREIFNAREREIIENYLQSEVAAGLQKLLGEAERRVQTINSELARHPTSTGVRFKLEWQPLPEGEEGAPAGLSAARTRLLNTSADAWSAEDRRVVGEFLQHRISAERSRDDAGSLLDHLSRALDYRRWHRFRVKRYQDGAWRPLSGPSSSGERALGLTVPLFAAASSHYASALEPHAPRLVLLDEAFAGIDDEARAHCMALIREFDLDFVMTSEREWGCYAELPGLAICNLVRREGMDAVFVSRWNWDGKARRETIDPSRRFPQEAEST